VPKLIVSERSKERNLAGEAKELDGCDCAATCGLLPAASCLDDVSGLWKPVYMRKFNPLHMPYDRAPHGISFTKLAAGIFKAICAARPAGAYLLQRRLLRGATRADQPLSA
jgi:hypothetical protein